MSNIQKLFSEKIEIFSAVEPSKVSVLTGIIKISLKVLVIPGIVYTKILLQDKDFLLENYSLLWQGCQWSGKFKVREKSGNFVLDQGILEF